MYFAWHAEMGNLYEVTVWHGELNNLHGRLICMGNGIINVL